MAVSRTTCPVLSPNTDRGLSIWMEYTLVYILFNFFFQLKWILAITSFHDPSSMTVHLDNAGFMLDLVVNMSLDI